MDTILGKRLLRSHVAAGLMHLLIFWGFFVLFIGTALLFIHDYLYSFLTGTPYLVFSLAMEAGGLVLIAGQDFFGPSSVDTSNGFHDLRGDFRMPWFRHGFCMSAFPVLWWRAFGWPQSKPLGVSGLLWAFGWALPEGLARMEIVELSSPPDISKDCTFLDGATPDEKAEKLANLFQSFQ